MTDFNTRQVAKSFQSVEVNDGDGAVVHRSIGSTHLPKLDPFLILNEFSLAHRGFQTVTYVFPTSKGGMLHEDFMGNQGELRAGDFQWMTAGRGIMHAEMPSSIEPACGLQLWINLPQKVQMIKPHYQEISRGSVAHVFNEDKSVEAVVFEVPERLCDLLARGHDKRPVLEYRLVQRLTCHHDHLEVVVFCCRQESTVTFLLQRDCFTRSNIHASTLACPRYAVHEGMVARWN